MRSENCPLNFRCTRRLLDLFIDQHTFFVCIGMLLPHCSDSMGAPLLHNCALTEAVISSRLCTIPGTVCPFNPTIVPYHDGYMLIFREDRVSPRKIHSRIGWSYMDKNLSNPTPAKFFGVPSSRVEDPRAILCNHQLMLITARNTPPYVQQALTAIDLNTKNIIQDELLTYTGSPLEKNWTPYIHTNKYGEEKLYYIYNHNPLVIITHHGHDKLIPVVHARSSVALRRLWENQWGKIRGGSPAYLVDGEYVEFFHSSSMANDKKIYYMGALRFQAVYPFTITSITKKPIIGKNFYTAMPGQNSQHDTHKKVLFPAGFVLVQDTAGRPIFHVACGENDVAIRIVTIDKAKLFASMAQL